MLQHPDGEDLKYVCLINPVANACSMRSREGETDIGEIAKLFGGGGHQAAAGFSINFTEDIERAVVDVLNKIDI